MTQLTAPTIAAPVPVGTDVTAGPITLRVEEAIIADGTATVASTSSQNNPPPDGLSYVLAKVTAVNNGQQVCAFAVTDFLVGSTDGILRRCPSMEVPDPPFNIALKSGETYTGWTGGLVNDVSTAVLLFDPAIPVGPRYAAAFALTDGAALPTYGDTGGEPTDVGSSLAAPAGLGETVRTGVWEVTINDTVDSNTYYNVSDYRVQALGMPGDGADSWQALGLDVTIRNVSATPQFFSWTALELVDTNGEPWDHLLAMAQPYPWISIELLPGATANGWYGIWLWPWATTSLLRMRDSRLTDDFRYISLDGTTGTAEGPEADDAEGGSTPDSGPAAFSNGDTAKVGNDPLNLRDQPATTGTLVTELKPGTEVVIISEAIDAESYRWYQVAVMDTGEAGYVVEDFLVPVDGGE
jgi:hypothetical protein